MSHWEDKCSACEHVAWEHRATASSKCERERCQCPGYARKPSEPRYTLAEIEAAFDDAEYECRSHSRMSYETRPVLWSDLRAALQSKPSGGGG